MRVVSFILNPVNMATRKKSQRKKYSAVLCLHCSASLLPATHLPQKILFVPATEKKDGM